MKYLNYTSEDVIEATKTSVSFAGVLRKLGIRAVGGNYKTVQKKIFELGLDTSHFTKQGWNKGKQLKDFNQYAKAKSFKKHLITLRGHKCELCNLSEWLGDSIMLELHHVDGISNNNDLTNLQLLCPNCHSTTDNWRNRKR